MIELPKIVPIDGALLAQYVRCGKPGCRCSRGKLHGPYWYRFARDGRGRLHKYYVRKKDVSHMRARIAEYQRIQKLMAFYNQHGWKHCTPDHAQEIQRFINHDYGEPASRRTLILR